MGANYTPSMEGYSGQTPFKFWCQSVLPSEYDDSMSYYELLNKVVTILNTAINDVDNAEKNIDALLNSYNELQDYVNHYFDSTDFQQKVNNKLDEMAQDNTLTNLLYAAFDDEFVPAIDAWLDANTQTISREIGANLEVMAENDELTPLLYDAFNPSFPGAVDDWLDEHIEIQGTSPALDATLTLANAAAPAKTVGDYCIRESTIRIGSSNYTSYSDANNFTVNRAYAIANTIIGDTPPAEPESGKGYVANLPQYSVNACLLYFEGHASTRIQLYFSATKMFYRTLNPNSAWKELAQKSELSSYATLANLGTTNGLSLQPSTPITYQNWQDYSDANALGSNRTYAISSRIINDPNPSSDYGYVAHLPAYNAGARLSFISAGATSHAGYQLYINTNGEFWARFTDSTGSGTWVQLAKRAYTSINNLRKYKVFCYGDSLTAGSGCSVPYHYYESIFGNIECHNYGVGGTGYIVERGSSEEPKNDYAGNGEIGKPASTTSLIGGNNILQYFQATEQNINTSTAITIFAGTNDFNASAGASGDTTEERQTSAMNAFETALRDTYTYILEHHTQPLIVCTPITRVRTTNSVGLTLTDYVNKILTVCADMKIPVIDFYNNVELRPDITAWKNMYYADDIHPNDVGQQLIGNYFKGKIEEYLN